MRPDRLAARILATWFGCGYWPWGPGTAGSLVAIFLALAAGLAPWQCAVAAITLLAPAVWASSVEAETCGRKDPGHVVVDEVAGQWITLSAAAELNWKTCLAAFVLFRLFDIWKPTPARQLEALPGGLGIMADDVMAGIYGAGVLAMTRWLNFT